MCLFKSLLVLLSFSLLVGCGPEALDALDPVETPEIGEVGEVGSEFTVVKGESRVGYILDAEGNPVQISFIVAEGRAIVGGDMDFGAAEDIATTPEHAKEMASQVGAFSQFRTGTSARWPDNGTTITIPYVKATNPSSGVGFTTAQWANITKAMNDFATKSRVRFVARTSQADYVRIYPGNDTCTVGRVGGMQDCKPTGNIWQVAQHELGHAVGLHHEHQRADRDTHVRVYLDRTTRDTEFVTFGSATATMSGGYDFNSIMHYGPTQFSSTGGHTIEPNKTKYPNALLWGIQSTDCWNANVLVKPMGCRTGVTAGDNAGINAMYGASGPNSRFIGFQDLPTTMRVGQLYTVKVVMENNGGVAWDPALGYKLGSQSPQDNMTWGLNRAALPGTIFPGQWGYITFTVRAPSTAGTYNFQWRMLREGVAWFGAYSGNQAISVTW